MSFPTNVSLQLIVVVHNSIWTYCSAFQCTNEDLYLLPIFVQQICISQTSTSNSTNEQMIIVLLIIAALAIGSFFVVAKMVGNWLLGSKSKVQRTGKVGEKSRVSKTPRKLTAASVNVNSIQALYPILEDIGTNAKLQNLQPPAPVPQSHIPASLDERARNQAAGLGAIHDWEVSTIDRIQHHKSRKLDRLSSVDVDQKVQDIYDVLAWEEATMRRFQQEKTRRLERLSLVDRQGLVSAEEQVGNAVRTWEGATKRKVEREKCMKAVGEWELSQKEKRSRIEKEKRAVAEDDGRTVLWTARFN